MPGQVVPDVAEVVARAASAGRAARSSVVRARARRCRACGATTTRRSDEQLALEPEACARAARRSGADDDLVLDRVDLVVDGLEDREEGVGEPVEDRVDERPARRRAGAAGRARGSARARRSRGGWSRRSRRARRCGPRRLGVQGLARRADAVEDEQDVVVVVVELRPLVPLARVLDRERVPARSWSEIASSVASSGESRSSQKNSSRARRSAISSWWYSESSRTAADGSRGGGRTQGWVRREPARPAAGPPRPPRPRAERGGVEHDALVGRRRVLGDQHPREHGAEQGHPRPRRRARSRGRRRRPGSRPSRPWRARARRRRRRGRRRACRAGPTWRAGSSASSLSRPIALTRAPSTATPNVPPTMRRHRQHAGGDAGLASRSTAFIAAVLIGDITKPMPMPIRMKAGSRNRYERVDLDARLPEQRDGDGDQPAAPSAGAGRCGPTAGRRRGRARSRPASWAGSARRPRAASSRGCSACRAR